MSINIKNLYKLNTKEDYFNGHKILGIYCMVHFIIRCILWIKTGNMQFDSSRYTFLSIIPHLHLSISSLIFKLPHNRNKLIPIMYPEFRLHSIIFALRSIIITLLFWFNKQYLYELRAVIVILTMLLSDFATSHFEDYGTTTRDMPNNLQGRSFIRYFYAISQIIGTMHCLFSTKIDQVFIILIPIQIGAFLKTLAKKGIINTNNVNFLYILTLLTNFIYSRTNNILETGFLTGTEKHSLTILFCFFRFYYNTNKYLLWNIIILYGILSNNF